MKENPEVHAGITEPKYWSPSVAKETGGCRIPCEGRESCIKRFPEAVLFHHSIGQWAFGRQNETATSMFRRAGMKEAPSCSREAWTIEEYHREQDYHREEQ